MAAEHAIEVRDLWKEYYGLPAQTRTLKAYVIDKLRGRHRPDEYSALHGVSFTVDPGDAVGLIGPNGSGKTTLLGVIAGVLRPTRGEVLTRGRVCVLLEAAVGFHPDLTGAENAVLQGMILGMSRAEVNERMEDIVVFADAEGYIDHPVRTHSLGQRARLGFSVAAHLEPDVLLVDEVLAVADEEYHHRCYRRIRQLRERGCAVVFVTHVMDQVREICDRVVLLDEGRITDDGPAAEVIDRYEQSTRYRDPDGRDHDQHTT